MTTNPVNRNRKPVQSPYTEETVSASIRAKKNAGKSLRQIAAGYGKPITHADIERILQGKFPVGIEKRKALKIPPVCITCGQKVKYVRHIPAWLVEATANLAALEARTQPRPAPARVYTRAGKRIEIRVTQ